MVPVSLACAYGLHRFWVTPSLTPLQRIYLRQYVYSTFKSYLRSQSRYTYMVVIVTNPTTKRDVEIGVRDEHVKPDLDEEGRVKVDNKLPIFRLKAADVNVKKFFWTRQLIPDKNAYVWFRNAIYEDQSIIDLWRPAWLSALIIFLLGTVGLTTLYQLFQHRYVKGEQVRGTRELSPREYRKEHRKHSGLRSQSLPASNESTRPTPRLFRIQSALVQVNRTA